MDNELYDLLDNMTADELMPAAELLEELAENTSLPEDMSSRIRSSVLQKAGLEMEKNMTNKRIRIKSKTDKHTHDQAELVRVRHSGAIAACFALLMTGAVGAWLIFGHGLKTTDISVPAPGAAGETQTEQAAQTDSGTPQAAESKARIVRDWAKPYIEQNPETVGYLKIEGIINGEDLETPVTQHDDNEFYFSHGFDMEPDENGTVMADCNVPIDSNGQPSNIVLYGQNMGEQTEIGFTSLLQYKYSEDFLKNHSVINFSTIYDEQDTEYQIFACFIIDINDPDSDPDFFDYRSYRNFDEEHSFDRWIKEINDRAIFKIDTDCTENDDYLTMSMVNEADDRFVLVAKKINHDNGDQTTETNASVPSEEFSAVPEVKGLSAEEAEKAISDAGFVPVMVYASYTEVPKGEAVFTYPNAGEKLKKGIEVECHVSLGNDEESTVPDVWGNTEEEARKKIEAAGFVPVKVEVDCGDRTEDAGTVYMTEYEPYADNPAPGCTMKYYVYAQTGVSSDVPDFNKIVYEDDDLRVTADKFMSDGNIFIMHLKTETKDGSPISDFNENWGYRFRKTDSGDRAAYVKGWGYGTEDPTVGGVIISWEVGSDTYGKELTLDLIDLKDTAVHRSETRAEKVTRETFDLNANVPTRTLTSEDGISITLSPMGCSWKNEDEDNESDPDESSLLCSSSAVYVITKDGQRIAALDYYRAEANEIGAYNNSGCCFLAYKDTDEIEAIEVNGKIFR